MNKSVDFIDAIALNDDELLVINGGQNEVTCGAGCGVGCGGGCGQGCSGCQKSGGTKDTPQRPSTYQV